MPSFVSSTIRWRVAAMLILVVAAGCGTGRYEVAGKVVFTDATPMKSGMVVFSPRDPKAVYGLRGEIQKDGSFRTMTFSSNDGAIPGEYTVSVTTLDGAEREVTSGRAYTVKARTNEFLAITVKKPSQKQLDKEKERN